MPRKAKPVVVVGHGDWAVEVPRPPKFATHARLTLEGEFKENGDNKVATLPIRDFGGFKGVRGDFYYLRMDNKRKITQEWGKNSWYWDGSSVEGIEKLKN